MARRAAACSSRRARSLGAPAEPGIVRFLLDELYSPEIARQLRSGRYGHDVVHAVDAGFAGSQFADRDVLQWATEHQRCLLTENVKDFMPLHRELMAQGDHHAGLVFTDPGQFPRSTAAIGLFVISLDFFIRSRPDDDLLVDRVEWLVPAQPGSR